MRLATLADYAAIEQIAHDTLVIAYPGMFVAPAPGKVAGFSEQLTMPGTIVCCTDDASAFILAHRWDVANWQVVWMMPLTMFAQTGKDLISFAMLQEHAVRLFRPTTTCYAKLSKASSVERATADAYKIILGAASVDNGRTITISRTAKQLAQKLGVVLA